LKDASTDQKGIVQLNNTLTSTSTTEAATANTVKLLNDRFTNDFLNLKSENGYQKLLVD
jgi:phage-related tail fiber protein